jgi:hypothetical protein
MKKKQTVDKTLNKNKKDKSMQIGSIVTLVDNDFSFAESKNQFTAAIVGVGKNLTDSTFAKIREEFYGLYLNNSIQILDFGNVELDETKLKKLISDINTKNLNTVFLCEDDEISAFLLNIQQTKNSITSLVLDHITSKNKHISTLFGKSKGEIAIIAYQNYFSDKTLIDKINKNHCTAVRLSEYRNAPYDTEPILRDSNFLAIDFASVRSSDGGAESPNGLYAEELCSIAHCAGLSNKISQMNIVCKNSDNVIACKLAAQTIWHFTDSLANRIVESPNETKFTKFIVDMGNLSSNLIFYKSNITHRWWLEATKGNKTKAVPCTFDDYLKACDKNIPPRWIKAIQKMR